MREPNHGEVTTWQMASEQLEEYKRNHPPLMPLKDKRVIRWHRITKQIYQKYKRQGLTDPQVCSRIPGITLAYLQDAKKRWGIDE